MPAKTSKTTAAPYRIDGKVFIWQPLDDNDERGKIGEVKIPLRVKIKVIRSLVGRELDVDAMFEILDKLAPGQGDVLDEMDANDFQVMFTTWQSEYQSLSGASLGE